MHGPATVATESRAVRVQRLSPVVLIEAQVEAGVLIASPTVGLDGPATDGTELHGNPLDVDLGSIGGRIHHEGREHVALAVVLVTRVG